MTHRKLNVARVVHRRERARSWIAGIRPPGRMDCCPEEYREHESRVQTQVQRDHQPNLGIRVILMGDGNPPRFQIPSQKCHTTRKCAPVATRRGCHRGKRGGVRPPEGGIGLNEGLCVGPMQRASRGSPWSLLSFWRISWVSPKSFSQSTMKDCCRTEGRKEAQSRFLGWNEGLPTSKLVK